MIAGLAAGRASAFGPYATVGEALALLASGRTALFHDGTAWRVVRPGDVAGHAPTRRLIDVPSREVRPVHPEEIVAVGDHPIPVVREGRLIGVIEPDGLVRDRHLAHDLANALSVVALSVGTTEGHQAIRHATELVRRLARAETVATAPLDRIVGDIADLLHGMSPPDTRLLLVISPTETVAPVTLVRRVLLNLVGNANAQLRPGDEVRVSVSGPTLTVADTGPGIPEHLRSRVFEPGFSTTEGTGLGLEIVRDCLDRIGASLAVSSVPGDTRFEVRFPR